jgi:hypothetical protein
MMVLFEGTINRPNGLVVDNSEQERASTRGSFAFFTAGAESYPQACHAAIVLGGLPTALLGALVGITVFAGAAALVRRRDAAKSPATP